MLYISKKLNYSRGSASILLLCILSLIICLAFIIFAKYNVTYKSSLEKESMTKSYYELNSLAQQYLLDLNNALIEAKNQSIDYIMNQGYTYPKYEGVNDTVQHELNSIATNAKTIDSGNKIVSKRIYTYYAYDNLLKLSDKYPKQTIIPLETDGLIESLAIEINFEVPVLLNNDVPIGTSYLKIKISVMPFPYSLNQESNAKISLSLTNNLPLYKITSYENWYIPNNL